MNTLIIANFKNFFSYHHEKNYLAQLNTLSIPSTNKLIVCPSVINTSYYAENQSGKWYAGAQYCTPFADLRQTGGLTASKLAECGTRYAIIGHYETRTLFNWSYQDLAHSINMASHNKLVPIICINDKGDAEDESLKQELEWLQTVLTHDAIVAYEPIDFINTSDAAPKNRINKMIDTMRNMGINNKIVYGGSVNAENAAELKKESIDGFIVGRSSTIFHELQKIVSL